MFTLNEGLKEKNDYNKKVKMFTDTGFVAFLYRFWWSNYDIQAVLQSTMRAGKIVNIEETLKHMEKPHIASEPQDFRELRDDLYEYSRNLRSTHVKDFWNQLEKKFKAYFDRNLVIYANETPDGKTGYCLKITEKELHYNGVLICKFNRNEMESLKALLPSLFTTKWTLNKMATGPQQRVKLTPDRLIKLIEIIPTNENTKNAAIPGFHPPVSKSFMSLFAQLQEHAALATQHKKSQDLRPFDKIMDDTIKIIKDNIDKNLQYTTNADKRHILQQINTYVSDPNKTNLAILSAAVQKYDKLWFSRYFYFSSPAEKTLKLVSQMHKSGFFQSALNEKQRLKDLTTIVEQREKEEKDKIRAIKESKNEISKLEKNAAKIKGQLETAKKETSTQAHQQKESREKLESEIKELSQKLHEAEAKIHAMSATVATPEYEGLFEPLDLREAEEKTHAYWMTGSVTKEAYEATLTMMLDTLKNEKEAQERADTDDKLPRIFISGSDQEKTVIDHLEDCIQGFQAQAKANNQDQFFQTTCASLQNRINKILSYVQDPKNKRHKISDAVQKTYINIGTKLNQDAVATEMKPQKKEIKMVSPVKARIEIRRLVAEYSSLEIKLEEFKAQLSEIMQNDFHNAIESFIKREIKTRIADLQKLLANIEACPNDMFDRTDPDQSSEEREKVCAAIDTLRSYGSELTDDLARILKYTTDKSDKPTRQQRAYVNTFPKNEILWSKKYNNIEAEMHTLMNGVAALVTPQISEIESNSKNQLSSDRQHQTTAYAPGLFKGRPPEEVYQGGKGFKPTQN